jgi:hypothetical protein
LGTKKATSSASFDSNAPSSAKLTLSHSTYILEVGSKNIFGENALLTPWKFITGKSTSLPTFI